VARFDGHDGSSRSQDARVLDEVCSTKVRSDTDVLHELGDRHHGCDIPEHTRKIELASRQRRLAKADDEFLEGGNMDGLVDLDDRDLGDGDVGGEETSIEEVGRLEFFQRLRVELCLEVLEDISKVFSYKKKISQSHRESDRKIADSLRTCKLEESMVRGSGVAHAASGARRAAAERYNVETRIFRLI